METWKPIKGYEGYYEVSDQGRVRRVDGVVKTGIKHSEQRVVKSRILKLHVKRNGYLTVDLSRGNIVKTIAVHKLVATAFIPQENGKTEVNHKNCDKADNRVENLEWVTPRENKDHAKANNRYYNPNRKPILCKQTQMVFQGSYKAAEWVNATKYQNSKQVRGMANKIREACNGHQATAYGFTWCYMEGSSTIS